MAELPFDLQDAFGTAPSVEVAVQSGAALPWLTATQSGDCKGLEIGLPPGQWELGDATSQGPYFRVQLMGPTMDAPEHLAVPEDLRHLLRGVRVEPDPPLGAAIIVEPAGNVDLRVVPTDDPSRMVLMIGGQSCVPAPGAAEANGQPVEIDTETATRLIDQAEEHMRTGDDAAASAVVSQLLTDEDNAHIHRTRELSGILAERAGRIAEARAIFSSFIADYPEHEAVPRINMRLGALGEGPAAEPDAVATPQDVGTLSRQDNPPSPWRTSVRGYFSQFYIRDRSSASIRDLSGTFPPGFVDRRVNVDELLTVANASVVTTNGDISIESRASAGYVAEFRPVQLTGSDRNQGSYPLLDQLSVSLALEQGKHRLTVGRQKEYGLGIFGRFDGVLAEATVGQGFSLRAAFGAPVWSERQTRLNRAQEFYTLSAGYTSSAGKFDANIYWFDQRAANETDRQAIGGQLRVRGDNWLIDGLADYDVEFDTINAAYLRGSLTTERGLTASVTGMVHSYPTLSLTNAIIGQRRPRLEPILALEPLETVRDAARDRTLKLHSLSATLTVPVADDLRLSGEVELSSLSGDPGSLGIPAFEASGTQTRLSSQVVASNLFRQRDTATAVFAVFDRQSSRTASADVSYRLPLGSNTYVAPRVTIAHRDQKDNEGSDTTVYPSVKLAWQIRPKVELQAQVGHIWRDERYINYDWNGERDERSFVAQVGYTLRF